MKMIFKTTQETVAIIREQTGSAPTVRTMNKKRCSGGGAPFVRRGRNIFYDPDLAVEWWISAMSRPLTSTSEYMPEAPSQLVDLKRPATKYPIKPKDVPAAPPAPTCKRKALQAAE